MTDHSGKEGGSALRDVSSTTISGMLHWNPPHLALRLVMLFLGGLSQIRMSLISVPTSAPQPAIFSSRPKRESVSSQSARPTRPGLRRLGRPRHELAEGRLQIRPQLPLEAVPERGKTRPGRETKNTSQLGKEQEIYQRESQKRETAPWSCLLKTEGGPGSNEIFPLKPADSVGS